MSYITDVVVHADVGRDMLHALTQPFDDRDNWLEPLPKYLKTEDGLDWGGGSKVFTNAILRGSFNYLDHDNLMRWFEGLDWGYDSAILTIISESGYCAVVVVEEGKIKYNST